MNLEKNEHNYFNTYYFFINFLFLFLIAVFEQVLKHIIEKK